MNSSPAVPDPSNASDAKRASVPVSPLDITVDMERPTNLQSFAPGAIGDSERLAARRNRSSTKRFEADSPHVMQPVHSLAKDGPAAHPVARQDATVEMPRPANVKTAPTASFLNATVEMERPAPVRPSPRAPLNAPPQTASDSNATVNMARPAVADLNATIEMARSPDSTKKAILPPNQFVTEALDLRNAAPERRGSGRASNDAPREAPEPDAPPAVPTYSRKLGEVLVGMGKLTAEQLDEAVAMAQQAGERIGRWLIRWELVEPDTLCRALSIQTGLPMTMLDGDAIPERLRNLFPLSLMMHHGFVPFDESGAVLCLAACDPLDPGVIRDQEKILNKVIEVFLAREDQVVRQLDWMRVKLKTRSRRCLRFNMRVGVSYQFCNRLGVRLDKDIHAGTTINVSEGGYLLEGPAVIDDPSAMMLKGLYLNVCVKSMTGEIWAICDVREIRLIQDAGRPRWLLGVEIVEINPDGRTRLKGLCRRKNKPAQ